MQLLLISIRALGQKCLARHVEAQKSVLLGFVDQIKISPQGDVDGVPVNNQEGVGLILNYLEQLRSQWMVR